MRGLVPVIHPPAAGGTQWALGALVSESNTQVPVQGFSLHVSKAALRFVARAKVAAVA